MNRRRLKGACDLSDNKADSKAPNGGDDGESAAQASTTNPYPPLLVPRLTNIPNRLRDGKHGTGQQGQGCRKE